MKWANKFLDQNKIILLFLFLYIGIVSFSIAIANICLGLALFVFVWGLALKKIELSFKKQTWFLYGFIVIPFVLTLLSALYSENHAKGLKYLWLRLPILIIPFVLLFMKIKNKDIKIGFKIFATLTIIASLKTLYNAFLYINEDVLFVTDFTFLITIIQHPYLGVFVLIAFVSIIEFDLIKNRPFKISVFILLSLVIALTTSRLVYVLFVLVIGIYLFKHLSNKKALLFGTLLSVIIVSLVLSNKSIKTKFQTSYQYENSPRLKLWHNAYNVIISSNNILFGIGIGDYYQDKKDVYFFRETEKGTIGYNPHSQIVEFIVTNGVFGLSILLFTLITGLRSIIMQNRFAMIIFGIIVMFSLTESILSRQYGVQLYSVFIPLIFKDNFKKKK